MNVRIGPDHKYMNVRRNPPLENYAKKFHAKDALLTNYERFCCCNCFFRIGFFVCVVLFCFLDVGVKCDYLEAVTEMDVSKRGFGVRS